MDGAFASAFFLTTFNGLYDLLQMERWLFYGMKTGFTTCSSNDLRSSKIAPHFACLACCQFIVFLSLSYCYTQIQRQWQVSHVHTFPLQREFLKPVPSIRQGSIRTPLGFFTTAFQQRLAAALRGMMPCKPCESLKHSQQSANNMCLFWTPRAGHWHVVVGNVYIICT